jgi:hypothetical protein
MASDSLINGLAKRVGLVYREGGEPLPGGPGSSRYERGLGVSPRLDQDLDALLAKVASLEARIATLEADRA